MAEERTEAGRDGSRGALAAFGALALVASVAGAAWLLGLLPERATAEARVEEPAVGALLPLDTFIANLDEFNARVPQMRDLMLTLLTSKLFAEVRTPEGKAVLRDEIIKRMNRALNMDLVKAVYFTEFIVQ